MKTFQRYSQVLFLLLGFMSSTAVPIATHADNILGKFTLTSAAHWGNMVLPPGDYTYSISKDAVLPIAIVRSTNGHFGEFVVPMSVSEVRKGGPDKLVLEKTDGGMVVTSLYLKDRGVVLHYRIPKAMVETAAKAPEPRLAASLQAK